MRRRLTAWIAGCVWVATMAAAAPVASAAPHDVRVPLRDGRLSTAELTDVLPKSVAAHLPAGSVDVRGWGGSLFVAALNTSLGDGCHLTVGRDAVVVRIDPDKLPKDWDDTRLAVRTFTATAAPVATAAQARRYGLRLPRAVDAARPLVVVVHGLDMTAGDMAAMDHQLALAGFQTAEFDYPPDGPIADDVALFAKHLSAVREAFPALTVDVIGYSMGGLIARGYVEGDGYAGGIDRLILIGTPNHGSDWAGLTVLAKARMTATDAFGPGEWHPTWAITGGLCEAGRDLTPGSTFLAALNAHARRAGVRYTVVTGDQTPTARWGAAIVGAPARWVPGFARNWWGVRQARDGLTREAARLRDRPGTGDGPVSLKSAALDGVTDVVVVHADHAMIYRDAGQNPPPAWAAVRERLRK